VIAGWQPSVIDSSYAQRPRTVWIVEFAVFSPRCGDLGGVWEMGTALARMNRSMHRNQLLRDLERPREKVKESVEPDATAIIAPGGGGSGSAALFGAGGLAGRMRPRCSGARAVLSCPAARAGILAMLIRFGFLFAAATGVSLHAQAEALAAPSDPGPSPHPRSRSAISGDAFGGSEMPWRWSLSHTFPSMSEDGLTALALDRTREWLAVGSGVGVTIGRPSGRGEKRSVRVAGVRDLWFGRAGELFIATGRGLWLQHPGRGTGLEHVSPGTGEEARRINRVAGLEIDPGTAGAVRVLLVATDGGAFVSSTGLAHPSTRAHSGPQPRTGAPGHVTLGSRWQRLDAEFPSGPVTSVAITLGEDALPLLWALVESALWRIEIGPEGELRDLREVRIPHRPREAVPVDIVAGLPGAELVIVYPGSISVLRSVLRSALRSIAHTGPSEVSDSIGVRDSRIGSWDDYRPVLPPGALLHRVGAWRGRYWLATDRGLLSAVMFGGPYRREGSPAGRTAFAALVGSEDRLYGAGDRGLLLAAAPIEPDAPGGGDEPGPFDPKFPSIRRVQLAALAHLGLGPEVFPDAGRRLSRRGWLPALGLRLGVDRDRAWSWDRDQSFLSGATRHLRDEDRDDSRDLSGSITMTWNLRDLSYDPEFIDLSREGRLVIALRDDVMDEINQLYFELLGLRHQLARELAQERNGESREVQIAGPSSPSPPPPRPPPRPPPPGVFAGTSTSSSSGIALNGGRSPDTFRMRLRAAELVAGLDAWTGGWFSESQRSADEDGV